MHDDSSSVLRPNVANLSKEHVYLYNPLMPATILFGKEAASKVLEELKPKIKELDPKLVIVQVGDNPASGSFIKKKMESCQRVGMRVEHVHLSVETHLGDLLQKLEELNSDTDVTGIIVQLPLPPHLAHAVPLVHRAIHPKKDVDGFTAYNLGKMFLGTEFEHLPPATPAGIITLLEHYQIPIEGRHAVIVGRSNIVGKPLGIMLLNRNATVTMCHSKTLNLRHETLGADILVAALGKPHFITKDMVKEGAVVIDVGVHKGEDGTLTGDVDFEHVKETASAITPVPGGVGPMTVASLIRNVVRAKERQMAVDN